MPTLTPEWIGLFVTILGFIGGVLFSLIKLLMRLGTVVASLDGLSESVRKLTDDVENWRATQAQHGERISHLEGSRNRCDDSRCPNN